MWESDNVRRGSFCQRPSPKEPLRKLPHSFEKSLGKEAIKTMIQAYGYLRVSSIGQGQDDKDGLLRQKLAIEGHAKVNDYEIASWFRDTTSGTNAAESRRAMAEMLELIQQGDVRVVIIERLDRLARDLMVQEAIIENLQRLDTILVSTREPDLCSEEPTRVLMRQILGAIASWERKMIVEKTRLARERMRARGERCEGQKPYGFYEGERETMALMCRLRVDEGMRGYQIAKTLNEAGLKARHGGQWWPMHIHRILKREGLIE
jgi:DNA invertase Pin-like site-specific DNA recombinase